LARRALAEALGAFSLTLVSAGAIVIGSESGGQIDHIAKVVAPGLLVLAFIYALGDASGAHYNPAVTLAFAARRVFPAAWVPLYWAAQLVGAVCAAALLRVVFGNIEGLGGTQPDLGVGPALTFEILLSWILITVILGTADRYRLVGPNAALAVGATIALCGLFASPVGGASMNPARSAGPAIVSGNLGDLWIYVVGPAVGAMLAVLTAELLHGDRRDSKTKEAAEGESKG
jgi:aquaporin Z